MNDNHHRDPRKTHDFLTEDAASPEDAATLEPVIQRLHTWEAPKGDPTRKAHLISLLAQEQMQQKARTRFKLSEWWPLLLIQSQLRVVERQIWLASALVMALGAAVTLLLDADASTGGLPFALLAPIIAAGGVAFLYDSDLAPVMEIERGTPASMRLIWLARITLVFVFDMVLGIIASLILSLISPSISLWSLVMTWLAPMALLSALAFLISVQRGDPAAGVLVSILLWSVQVVKHMLPEGVSWLDLIPNLLGVEARLWSFALALLCLGAALWMVGRISERPDIAANQGGKF
jgi:hypothetical protein